RRADEPDRQRDLQHRAAVLVLDRDAPDVALVDELLDLGDDLVAADAELLGSWLVVHRSSLPAPPLASVRRGSSLAGPGEQARRRDSACSCRSPWSCFSPSAAAPRSSPRRSCWARSRSARATGTSS